MASTTPRLRTFSAPIAVMPPPVKPPVFCATASACAAPGHCMIVVGPDGTTDYLVFHAWDGGMQRRQMYVEPLVWTEKGPRLAALAG